MAIPPSSPARVSPLKRKRSLSPPPPSRLPAPLLLLSLPALLALPPTHPHHVPALRLSLLAVRRCLQLKDHGGSGMTPEIECRAWTAFVEVGMKIVGAGLSGSGNEGEAWARGLENDIVVAAGKGLVLSQKHPSLRLYTHHLTILHSRLVYWQHNYKFACALLRRHVATLSSLDPPTHHYTSHLTLVSHALACNPVDLPTALHSLAAIHALAERWGHPEAALLAQVIKLRALVSALNWAEVFPLLDELEPTLDLVFSESQSKSQPQPLTDESVDAPKSALRTSLQLHVLVLGVLAHVQAGHSADVSKRIKRLHTVLDTGALERGGVRDGIVEVPLNPSETMRAPLFIHTTHPRVFFHLAFLVSAVAMRDATGRRPKPKLFATEGLAVCERERPKEGRKIAGRYLPWAGLRERQDVEDRLAKIEADLLCELVGVSIQRSEFDEAEEHLAKLIAHTRTHAIWDAYSSRIALKHAHLAHALCRRDRALECYRAAAYLALKQERGRGDAKISGKVQGGTAVARFVRVSAQVGEVSLRIGAKEADTKLKEWGSEVAKECRALGGMFEIVGRVLEACLTDRISIAKNILKASLDVTTSLDNHLRALVLALLSSHYLHTSPEHAEVMLTTARHLAAGLGAPVSKEQDLRFDGVPRVCAEEGAQRKVGNAPLGLWVGERFLELYRRAGKDSRAKKQDTINRELANALKEIKQRGRRAHDADGDVCMG